MGPGPGEEALGAPPGPGGVLPGGPGMVGPGVGPPFLLAVWRAVMTSAAWEGVTAGESVTRKE